MTGIPSPVNDKLIDALFSVSSRIREIRKEMDKLAEDSTETDESKDFYGFESLDPLEESQEDGRNARMSGPHFQFW